MPDSDLASILAHRLGYLKNDILQELLQLDGVEECLQESDKKDTQKLKEEGMIENRGARQFSEDLRQFRKKRCPPPKQQAGRGKKGAASVASSSHITVGGKRFTRALPPFAADFSNQDFNDLLPDGVRAAKEAFHGRWGLFWVDGAKSRSATWALHGWGGSIKLLLKEAWLDYETWTGHACPWGAELEVEKV
jgi:hypothetical protein